MKCPRGIDDLQLIDLVEGELDSRQRKELLSHIGECQICSENYNSLLRTSKMLFYSGDNADNIHDPGEEFWEENRRAIASQTFLKDNVVSLDSVWNHIRKSQAFRVSLAAAAVLLIMLGVINYQTGVNNQGSDNMAAAEQVSETNLTAEQYALLDSLKILQQKIADYELTASALETLGEYVYSTEQYPPLLDENPASGSSIYSSMMGLDEDELDIVAYALASNDF